MEGRLTKDDIQRINEYCPSKEDFFKESSAFIANKLNLNPEVVLAGFEKREQESCTAIGSGFAIPHAILKEAEDSFVFLHLIDNGVNYGAYDNEEVTVAFSLIIAEDNYNELHLRKISSIARSLMNEQNQLILKTERDLDKLVNLVNEMEENL